jgi:hypothetical protein
VFKDEKGKSIAGAVKGVDQHKGPYMDSPFSLKLGPKRIAHFRLISQKAESLLDIIIDGSIEAANLFQVSAD